MMDAVLLSRIQFGLTAGFHFLFPPLSIGLILIIVIIESLHLKTGEEFYENISTFLVKIFGLVFTIGVATGIVLEFAFGTNWSNFSRKVGDIFGAPLAAEAIFAFFLESIFLGILMFGRKKVSQRAYLISAILVLIGSHLSGFWIIIANSWMQTPDGYKIIDGRIFLTDFFAATFNHSTLIRFIHTIIGAWITGSLFAAGISSWYLLKEKNVKSARILLKIALLVFVFSSMLQFAAGHGHSIQVAITQPAKMAAFEGLWATTKGAPMTLFGIPDEKNRVTHFEIAIPKLLSMMIHFDPDATVKGLNEFAEEDQPPVLLPFMSYHFMIASGVFFASLSIFSIILLIRKKIFESKRFMKILLYSIPVPFLANESGWIAAEVGRQPWAIYGILRTRDAVSIVVPAGQILFSIIMFTIIYIILFFFFITYLKKILNQWSDEVIAAEDGY